MVKHLLWLILFVLAACTPKTPAELQDDTARIDDSVYDRAIRPRLATLPTSKAGDAAAMPGIISIDGPCIYAKAATQKQYLIASTNPEIHWDTIQQALILSNARVVKPGGKILLGGSAYTGKRDNIKWLIAPGYTCDTSHVWITNFIS